MRDPDSVYCFCKKMIALRRSAEYSQTRAFGDILPMMTQYDNAIAYRRKGE